MKKLKTIILALVMGIFGNLFGQNKHIENFEFFNRNENEIIQFIVVDIGLNEIAPINSKPNILKISFQILKVLKVTHNSKKLIISKILK